MLLRRPLILPLVAWAENPFMIQQWLRLSSEAAVFRRVDGRLSDYPHGCCTSTCGASLSQAELKNVPINLGNKKSLNDHIAIRTGQLLEQVIDSEYHRPYDTIGDEQGETTEELLTGETTSTTRKLEFNGDDLIGLPVNPGGFRVSSDSEMKDTMTCLEKFKEATNCVCRLDVDITASHHYLCEPLQDEWWRHLGNSHLTGGPYQQLVVDEVVLGLVMPWAKMDEMLWVYLFSNDDDEPCKKPYSSRKLTFLETSFHMNQFTFHLKPNNTITVPSAWSFVTQPGWYDRNWYLFKDVTTRAHMSRGTYHESR